MELAFTSLVLALVVGSCLALSKPLLRTEVEIDTERSAKQIADSLAVRMLRQGTEMNQLAPIPEEVRRLNLILLYDALKVTRLEEPLSGKGPFTLFAPDNEAILSLPDWVKTLTRNVTILAELLKFHAVSGVIKSSDLKNDLLIASLQGPDIRINKFDKVGKYNITVYTAQCAPFDLFRVDHQASNGLIHVVERVMIPPVTDGVASLALCPEFSTLTKAINIAKLDGKLSTPGPWTIFAPTDDAFAKLPPGTLEKLLKDITALTNVLEYHVVNSTLCSAGLSNGRVKTVQGKDLQISVDILVQYRCLVSSSTASATACVFGTFIYRCATVWVFGELIYRWCYKHCVFGTFIYC
ncbi:fasciclin domain-containing protein [Plakobranchus ocellatus]|uniref:Fasciclin domain-containing protein n=1 Tax=Plakobranchus ocellatus TaxID=259542 RepID=A0AAV4AKH8_9GAST|nr:fasciclin domain-containing protein [Plakobranchus ocellatus]